MFQSFWKAAWRNIVRQRVFAIINVSGLALGICFCLVIFLVVRFEFSFDHFERDGDRIYRVGRTIRIGNDLESFNASRVMPALPEAIRREVSGVEAMTAFDEGPDIQVSLPKGAAKPSTSADAAAGTDSWAETLLVNPDYFSFFSYRWLAGNPQTLQKPSQIVLTASRARQYFGKMPFADMLGRQLMLNDTIPLYVSGVVADWTENSDLTTHEFISYSTIDGTGLQARYSTDSWGNVRGHADIWCFVKLTPGVAPQQVATRINAVVKAHVPWLKNPEMHLLPLSEIHFDASYSHDDIRKAHKPTLYGVMALAAFILILAVINFINLSTAQSMRRSREVGIRKVLGSGRAALTLQFLLETLVVVVFAVLLSTLLVTPVLRLFHDFIPPELRFTLNGPVIGFLVGITLLTTVLAGYYPARVLSGYRPVISLKGATEYQGNAAWTLRRGLIVFQFTMSLAFIICTLVVGRQVGYILRTDYGYNKDAVLTVMTNWRDSPQKLTVLENKLSVIPGIIKITRELSQPIGWGHFFAAFSSAKVDSMVTTEMATGGETYVPFYGIRIVAGRNLHHTDSLQEVLINETAARFFGFGSSDKAVGQFLYTHRDGKKIALPIVGVVADYHTASFHDAIHPLVIGHAPENERSLGIRLANNGQGSESMQTTLSAIRSAYKSVYPGQVFNYAFMDESIRNLYEDEQHLSLLVQAAMLVTIFISCMGLFGVSLFAAAKRTREVSIRKVLGARVTELVLLLCRDFILLVGLAILIATPIAWWAMHRWLNGFVYRIDLGLPLFLEAGLAGMLLALATVGFHAVRAARTNPVNNLRQP